MSAVAGWFACSLDAPSLDSLRRQLRVHFQGTAFERRYGEGSPLGASIVAIDRVTTLHIAADVTLAGRALARKARSLWNLLGDHLPYPNRELVDFVMDAGPLRSDGFVPLRFDMFLGDAPGVFEINAGNIAGLPRLLCNAALQHRYSKAVPWLDELRRGANLAAEDLDGVFPEYLRKVWGAAKRIAFVTDVPGAAFAEVFRSYGYDVVVSEFPTTNRAWNYGKGGLHFGDHHVDAIFFSIDPASMFAHCSTGHPLMRAYRDGAAEFSFSLADALVLSNKALLHYLTEPEVVSSVFSDGEAAALRRLLVPTTTLTEANAPDLMADRPQWVIKPAGEVSGIGVVVGLDVDDYTWTQSLAEASRSGRYVYQPFLVPTVNMTALQRSASAPVVHAEVPTNVSPLILDGRLQSWLGRQSPGNIISWGRGDLVPVYSLDERP